MRRYRDKLYCLTHDAPETIRNFVWQTGELSVKISEHQVLELVHASSGISFDQWQQSIVTVQARKGGEKLRLPNRIGRHSLKDLFQEAGIPPWKRELTPLIYLDEELVAVGDLWISADYYQVSSSYPCVKLKLINI